jgi:AcrR family transcriptional regulator
MICKRENTKEKILLAAFDELSYSVNVTLSLSKIAKKLGISKAAIFRHYKDKETLYNTMQERFFDDIVNTLKATIINGTDRVSPNGEISTYDLLRVCIRFLAEKTEYFGFIRSMCLSARNIEPMLTAEFDRRGIKKEHTEKNDFKSPEGIYAFTTVVYYILQYRALNKQEKIPSEKFTDELFDFLINGWKEIHDLTDEEKKHYDKLCEIQPDAIPEEDRFFSALMTVIFKYGFLGITVERIADEVGMAKSSLYAFFENKEALFRSLIEKELTNLAVILSERLNGVTDLSGAVYVFLHLVYRYLILRPAFILVIVWHFSQGGNIEDLYLDIKTDKISDGLKLILMSKNLDFNIKLPGHSTATWLSALPAAMLICVHKAVGGGVFRFDEGYDFITKVHWQMGHKLTIESGYIFEKEFA